MKTEDWGYSQVLRPKEKSWAGPGLRVPGQKWHFSTWSANVCCTISAIWHSYCTVDRENNISNRWCGIFPCTIKHKKNLNVLNLRIIQNTFSVTEVSGTDHAWICTWSEVHPKANVQVFKLFIFFGLLWVHCEHLWTHTVCKEVVFLQKKKHGLCTKNCRLNRTLWIVYSKTFKFTFFFFKRVRLESSPLFAKFIRTSGISMVDLAQDCPTVCSLLGCVHVPVSVVIRGL